MADAGAIRRIIIVGGGTAGWMTAAALAKFLVPSGKRIAVVESDAIGTVRVGEGTVPPILEFNLMLGLDEGEFLRETQATYKLGIDFVGWTREGERYFHQFGHIGRPLNGVPLYQLWLRNRENPTVGPLADYSMSAVAAANHRFAHPSPDPTSPLSQLGYAFHFDAGAYGQFLRRFAEAHGAERIEGRIIDVEQDSESGFVTSVQLEGERRVRGDLFIDCSGFRSLLLGQKLGVPFEDWSHWLPCDRAIAVQSAPTSPLLPYTRSAARQAGWQWRIPLQRRIGNGHVYCSAFMEDDEAERVLLETLDAEPITEPNRLRFTAGRRARSWEANVIAIGLSSGFLEPLESTSIHLVQHGIQRLLSLFPSGGISPVERDEYNRHMVNSYEPIRDFIILHYVANGRGEPFWHQMRNLPLPDALRHKIELFRENGRVFRYNEEFFDVPSWVAVMLGQDIIPVDCDPLAKGIPEAEVLRAMSELRHGYEAAARQLPLASEFIERRIAATQ